MNLRFNAKLHKLPACVECNAFDLCPCTTPSGSVCQPHRVRLRMASGELYVISEHQARTDGKLQALRKLGAFPRKKPAIPRAAPASTKVSAAALAFAGLLASSGCATDGPDPHATEKCILVDGLPGWTPDDANVTCEAACQMPLPRPGDVSTPCRASRMVGSEWRDGECAVVSEWNGIRGCCYFNGYFEAGPPPTGFHGTEMFAECQD